MDRSTTFAALAALLAVSPACAAPAPAWELASGLSAPESAYVVPGKDWLVVSNVAGSPADKDGKGWLTRVSLDGKVLDERWVDGLNAPKGMRSAGGTLYVADVDELVEVSLKSGKVLRRIKADGAKFLNDVAVFPNGTVWVSDTMRGAIFQLIDGKTPELAVAIESEALESPNGLYIRKGVPWIASWGPGLGPDWSTKAPGRLLAIDPRTKAIVSSSEPIGNLDGLEPDGDAWLVSDWSAGKVYRVAGGKPQLLLEGFKGAADLGWHAKRRLLIVPRMGEDRVSAFRL
ncbi:MAG: ATP/GTP-binding protein [Elusimicrobia bacterium]|nr:ATP/GTP-binding protein [Elusimicrobiota bacterium]